MRRLVIFTSLPEVGGHTTTTIGICNLLREFFDEIEVLCKSMPSHGLSESAVVALRQSGCRVTMLGNVKGSLNPLQVARVFGRYAVRPADVFLTIGMRNLSPILARIIRAKLSIYYHITHDLNPQTVQMLCRYAKAFDKILFISPATYHDFAAMGGPAVKVDWCLQGSDLGIDPISRPQGDQASQPIRFGLLGRLTRPKGAAEMISVIDADAVECEVHVAGVGEFAEQFQSRAAAPTTRSRVQVKFLGSFNAGNRIPFLRAFFEQIDWLCVPTIDEWESISMVLLEALQHGVPVLINRTGGLKSFDLPELGPPPPDVVRLVDPLEFSPVLAALAAGGARTEPARCVSYYRQYFDKAVVARQWARLLEIKMDTAGRPTKV